MRRRDAEFPEVEGREARRADARGAAVGRRARLERKLAHKLAGSFALYGFAWASAQSRAIETAAAGEAGWLAQIAELGHHLGHVEIRYSDGEPVADR